MPVREITHDEHKHKFLSVNEEIFGLKINDSGVERISEAFGWPDEKFDKVRDTMRKYFKFLEAAHDLDPDMPEHTKVSSLVEYLKSNAFRSLGIKIETPNDYFMLGLIWNAIIVQDSSMGLGGSSLISLLKELSRK